jgi:hypothetical protein
MKKVHTISQFLAVDTNLKDFEKMQENIIEYLIRNNSIRDKRLKNILFELIKKKCNFSDFITSLKEKS